MVYFPGSVALGLRAPRVSEFFGIQITFNYRGEHNPPHFHAWHAGCEGVFAIRPLSYLYGDLSPRAVAMVMEWGLCCMEMN